MGTASERHPRRPWKEFWDHLQLKYVHFADVGLALDSPDALVWQTCQDRELILITDNRNLDGPDSLEATIRAHNAANSLPVFTIADVQRLGQSHVYAFQVVERLLESLLRIDTLRGTGRLYVP
jgi:hypothetical protein